MGITKAAVFPVPVCAHPRTSRPASAWGMACAWMAVGSAKPALVRFRRRVGDTPRVSKLVNEVVCTELSFRCDRIKTGSENRGEGESERSQLQTGPGRDAIARPT